MEAVTSSWSSDRTGVRLSPTMNAHGMRDSNPGSLFIQAADMLSTYDLSYLHVAEAIRPGRLFNPDAPRVTPFIRQTYDGNLIANGGYDRQSAVATIEALDADAIAFGQSFIANPDLPARFEANAPLNSSDPATFYTPGPKGYTDYPIMTQVT
ncbi:N-ethylmaleimide reductase [Planctomycetes bacterium FF15]|uniref:N-ethylmaleimide reductase n=1 Tax=Bremerella alba TaxID=980252 RepID=A0A7V8VB08_9BACT|nr:N-ethylmaleimide reductase [Bremerella alba]